MMKVIHESNQIDILINNFKNLILLFGSFRYYTTQFYSRKQYCKYKIAVYFLYFIKIKINQLK